MESGLEDSLRSFFQQDYPQYELVFCVAEPQDPCLPVIAELMKRFPQTDSTLTIGAAQVGANPKINNLLPGYGLARNEIVLVSDSNVRVPDDYLKGLARTLRPDVGVVTASVAGTSGEGLGGRLESAYLNTFAARWMQLCFAIGKPFVIGKTMLFRKSLMDRCGGLKVLGRYIAEDFMTGEAMRQLGYRVVLYNQPVAQFIGKHSVKAFWARHVRWGRIRKNQYAPGFFMEPTQYALTSGAMGAIAFASLWGVSPMEFLIFHCGVWGCADALLIWRMEGRLTIGAMAAWCIRECIALPHWLHAVASNHVLWRGNRLRILEGGLVTV